MERKDILDFIGYKKDKDYKKLEQEILPVFEKFVAISEQYVFSGDFSADILKIRVFCLVNYLRMVFSEAEYKVSKNELTQDVLDAEYSKLSEQLSTFKDDIKKILNIPVY